MVFASLFSVIAGVDKPSESSPQNEAKKKKSGRDAPFEPEWTRESLLNKDIIPKPLTKDYAWVLAKDREAVDAKKRIMDEAKAEEEELDKQNTNFTEKKWFTLVIAAAVSANAVQMGVEIDNPDHTLAYAILENLFAIIFTVEMCCKIYFYRRAYFNVGWNVLDFCLVMLSIFDLWIMQLLVGTGTNTKKLSGLRMLRILRVVRMVRLLKVFRKLWLIIKGIIDSVQTIFWAGLLITLILYVFSILFVNVVGSHDGYARAEGDDIDYHPDFDVAQYYGNVLRSMYTCFETTLEPLNLRPVIERQPEMFIFFLGFIFIATFGVMNVIVGVIVETTMEAATAQNKEQECKLMLAKLASVDKMRDACRLLDVDGDGIITQEEVKDGFSKGNMAEYFEEVELPLGTEPQEIYDLLNPGGYGSITHLEVVKHLLRAIAVEPATVIVELLSGYHRFVSNVRASLEFPAELHVHTGRRIDAINDILADYKQRLQCVGEVVGHLGGTIPQRKKGMGDDPMFMNHSPELSTALPDSADADDMRPGINLSQTQDVLASGRTKVSRPEARPIAPTDVVWASEVNPRNQMQATSAFPERGMGPSASQEARGAVPKLNFATLGT